MAVLDAIARIDVERAKRAGEMLIMSKGQGMAEPERVLIDVAKLNASQLLDEYDAREACYATAPFDVNGDYLRFYRGGVTVWSGYPGAGKTTILRQSICQWIYNEQATFIASLEEDPADLIIRICATAFGVQHPNKKQLQWFMDFYADRLRVWGTIGIAKHKDILGVIQHLAEKGLRHAVIDSLMCLDIDNGDYEKQRQFANLLATTARATGVHVHLVAHPRKVVSADQEPDINDVAGAREIGGIADNVIFIRRGKEPAQFQDQIVPMGIAVRKQRHGTGWLGNLAGWFNRERKQFQNDQFDTLPRRYLPKEAYE